MKDSRDVRKCLSGIFCRECVYVVVSSLVVFLIFFAICGIVCVKLAHSSLGGRWGIFISHRFIIIIKSEVSTFPICHIFRGCMPGVVCHHMLSVSYISMESRVLFCLLLCSFIICANNRIDYSDYDYDGRIFYCLHFTLPH